MNKKQEIALREVVVFAKTNVYSTLYHALPEVPDDTFEEFFQKLPPLSVKKLRAHAGSLVHSADTKVRYLLSEFDFKNMDKTVLLAQSVSAEWDIVAREIKAHNIHSALHILPKHWQTGPMFYRTCRAHGVISMPLTSANEETKVHFVKEAGVDMIVSTPEEVQWTATRLRELGLEENIRSWVVIAPLGTVPDLPEVSGDMHVEHHVFPGIPLGVSTDGVNVRLSDEYFVESDEKGIYITSLEKHAVPFIRLFMPGHAEIKSTRQACIFSFTLENNEGRI